jgi:hypothetical protein
MSKTTEQQMQTVRYEMYGFNNARVWIDDKELWGTLGCTIKTGGEGPAYVEIRMIANVEFHGKVETKLVEARCSKCGYNELESVTKAIPQG